MLQGLRGYMRQPCSVKVLWATWCLTNNREKGKIVAVKGVKSCVFVTFGLNNGILFCN